MIPCTGSCKGGDILSGKTTNCESCVHYIYDDEWECYCCEVNLDEDEMGRFLAGTNDSCSYYQLYDEYKMVRRQN